MYKRQAYMSGYYLQTVPQSVKAAWQETLEETGFNPFQTDVTLSLIHIWRMFPVDIILILRSTGLFPLTLMGADR